MPNLKQPNICINVVSSLSHLELLQYDAEHGNFIHLDTEEFSFDPATREMLDEPERFQSLIKRLFDKNKIPYASFTSLVLPSFFTRQYTVPDDVSKDDMEGVFGHRGRAILCL